MKDFWVAHWLHCPPEREFVNGQRVILKKLCFGPGESQVWFVTEDGRCWYEETILEGIQAGEHLLELGDFAGDFGQRNHYLSTAESDRSTLAVSKGEGLLTCKGA